MKNKAIIEMGTKQLFLAFSIISMDGMPFLFAARDKTQSWYLCLCNEMRYGIHWIVTPSDLHIISQLIGKRITINQAIEQGAAEKFKVSFTAAHGYTHQQCEFSDIDPLDLAEEGLFVEYPDDDTVTNLEKHIKDAVLSSLQLNNGYRVNTEGKDLSFAISKDRARANFSVHRRIEVLGQASEPKSTVLDSKRSTGKVSVADAPLTKISFAA